MFALQYSDIRNWKDLIKVCSLDIIPSVIKRQMQDFLGGGGGKILLLVKEQTSWPEKLSP
jgi:hypothetical protein